MTRQNTVRAATGVWFAVLLGGLMATDTIATLDHRVIGAIVVAGATVMFTCMQVIVRESLPPAKLEVTSVRRFRERPLSGLLVRNLVVVSVLYGLLWITEAIPF
jgi:hypothetical protein